jgi:SAM-dependent methyltransferase
MFRATRDAVSIFVETFRPSGPVLEVGSYLYHGLESYQNVRPLFPGREYVGCDIRWGVGVDRLEDAQRLSFANESFGTVLAFDILEHIPDPRAAAAEAWRVLRNDGLYVVAVPFGYRLHGLPTDYWRFTASGLHTVFSEFERCVVFSLGPKVDPPLVFGVAGKQGLADFDERARLFRERIERYYGTARSRLHGQWSIARRLARDSLGWMLGRAHVGVEFFDPLEPGGYEPDGTLLAPPRSEPLT